MTKPLLKWVGGKYTILNELHQYFPSEIDTYYEPFVGGGSVLLSVLTLKHPIAKKYIVTDNNLSLIGFYNNVKLHPNLLFKKVEKLQQAYDSCESLKGDRNPSTFASAKKSKESFYYWIRNEYNREENVNSISQSARFIFLNKTGFRGLYRVGPNGFNVPFGHYKNPTILIDTHLQTVSKLIQGVDFYCNDYSDILLDVKHDDFVYLDPPYVPVTLTSFTKYSGEFIHEKFFENCKKLRCDWVMSNSATNTVLTEFENKKIVRIKCKRRINSKNPAQTQNEVIIY